MIDAEHHPGKAFAERLLRAVSSLASHAVRVSYLRTKLASAPDDDAAQALEYICVQRDAGDASAREFLVGFAGLLHEPEARELVARLRVCAERAQLDNLGHMLTPAVVAQSAATEEQERRVPDYGTGRPLTLGERKSLARRPTRRQLDRLLTDPHPMVIRNLLANPVTTEDDVVRLAARRPLAADVIAEIARHPRWNVRRRVRMALVLNPSCPVDIALPIVGVLLRAELQTVASSTELTESLRAAVAERLQAIKGRRRDPSP